MLPLCFVLILLLSLSILSVAQQKSSFPLHRNGRSSAGNVNLYGGYSSIGEYYLVVSVGNPPQTFNLQLDTGSSDIGIPADYCQTCKDFHERTFNTGFQNNQVAVGCSSGNISFCPTCDYTNDQCSYTIQYGDGSSYSATVFQDNFTVNGFTVADQVFGLISSETPISNSNYFEASGIDGIFVSSFLLAKKNNINRGFGSVVETDDLMVILQGLAYTSASVVGARTFLDNLVETGQVQDMFSICFGTNAGVLTLGGDGGFHSSSFQYTAISRPKLYTIFTDDVQVDGISLGLSQIYYNSGSLGTILDTGTTLITVSQTLYSAIRNFTESLCPQINIPGVCNVQPGSSIFDGVCFDFSPQDLSMFPPITFVFGAQQSSQIKVDLQAMGYLVQGGCANDPSGYSIGLMVGVDDGNVILGGNFLQQFQVLFDRKNQQIGFAAVQNCGGSPQPSSAPPFSSDASPFTSPSPSSTRFPGRSLSPSPSPTQSVLIFSACSTLHSLPTITLAVLLSVLFPLDIFSHLY